MVRKSKGSFLSRVLFRESEDREDTTVVANNLAAKAHAAMNASADELFWASNGDRSVEGLVERVLKGAGILVVTGYQDFLSAMSIILHARPGIASDAPETVRILFGTNTDNRATMGGSEPPRVCRRLRTLRRWSHDEDFEPIFP